MKAVKSATRVRPRILVVMGVSGTGKTTIATGLARRLGWEFQEGDELHPPANVAKMHSGQPLTDEDRRPWLEVCHQWLKGQYELGHGAVLTCSALKRAYREQLRAGGLPVEFVFINTSQSALANRLEHREGHYMPASLLPSQLATLEVPGDDEAVIRISGEQSPDDLIDELVTLIEAEG